MFGWNIDWVTILLVIVSSALVWKYYKIENALKEQTKALKWIADILDHSRTDDDSWLDDDLEFDIALKQDGIKDLLKKQTEMLKRIAKSLDTTATSGMDDE